MALMIALSKAQSKGHRIPPLTVSCPAGIRLFVLSSNLSSNGFVPVKAPIEAARQSVQITIPPKPIESMRPASSS